MRTIVLLLAAAAAAFALFAAVATSRAEDSVFTGGRDGLINRLKSDLGMLGWRGRRDESIRDPREAAKDLELRRMQQEKEKRIGEARQAGAEFTYDDHQRVIFRKYREEAAAARRLAWRAAASPGS